MALLERLRPRWRHADPAVRLAAVREMSADDAALREIAQDDPDAHVRRAALKRLDDPELLGLLAQADPDPALRQLAGERARERSVAVAVAGGPVDRCRSALDRLTADRQLATVAATAAHEEIRRAALERLTDQHVLRDVVRQAADPATAHAALARISDAGVLRAIATGDGAPDLALAALERIDDAETLRAITDRRAVAKAVRQRAHALLAARAGGRPPLPFKEARTRQLALCIAVEALEQDPDPDAAATRVREAREEWDELARAATPRADVGARFEAACEAILHAAALQVRRSAEVDERRAGLAARERLCARVEAAAGAEAGSELEAARATWQRLVPLADAQTEALAERFARACRDAEARRDAWRAGAARRRDLEAIVEEAERLAAASPPAPRQDWEPLAERWATLADAHDGGLAARFAAARERFEERRRDDAQQDATRRQQNVARLERLCTRLAELAAAERVKLATARRELRAAEGALADLGPLPPGERRAAWTERLTAARDELQRRVDRDEETEQWRRWANAGAQQEIIRRVEALLEANDLAEGVRLLAGVQEEWAAVASAPADVAQTHWQRFRAARDELRRRCDTWLGENLAKKRALVARAAELAESTAWNETAEEIRRLQAAWKVIGPVPGRHVAVLWREFRTPCDRFFARRRERFERLDAERQTALAERTTLCERAEALADSTDWEATAAALRQLQADWKRAALVPGPAGEAVWQRFRAACDRFFERRSRREEIAREQALAAAARLCDDLEALAAALREGSEGPDPADVGPRVDAAWGEWLRLDVAARAEARPLAERLAAACAAIAALRPEALHGTRLDPAATRTRREKLCARLEALAPAAPARPASLQEMALALRERLAANTIMGPAARRAGPAPDAEREAERIEKSWAHLGPPLDDDARALAERFARARAAIAAARA